MSPRKQQPFTPREVPGLTRPRRPRPLSVAERVLPNGLRVVAVRRASVPVVHARLRVPTASRRDADLARTVLLGRTMMLGTAQRSQHDLAEALQRIGGSLRVDAGTDGLSLSGESLRSGMGDLLDVLAEVVTAASYPRAAVEREAGRLGDHLRRALSQPGVTADVAWLSRRYGEHPYGREYPSPEEVAGVAAASLRASHRRRMVPDGSLLVLVGDLTPARALDRVERALEGWRADGHASTVGVEPHVPHLPLLLVDRPGAVQSNLRVGGAAPRRTDPSYPAAQLANALYGGYFSSRLTMNIREDKGYTYSPHSAIRHLAVGSRVVTSAEVATEVTAPALMEVLYELGRISLLPPEAEELDTAAQYLIGTLSLGAATQAGLAETLADLLTDGLSVDWLREHPSRLAAVTPEQVLEAASSLLAPSAMVSVVVGDADVVADGLRALTEVERPQ
jgi:zinc protease